MEEFKEIYFFRIYIETKIGNTLDSLYSKDELAKIDKNQLIKLYNNDSSITPDNWHNKKDILFKQHMEKYEDSYTLNEKIKLELKALNNLPISSADYEILAERYKKYLTNKTKQQN